METKKLVAKNLVKYQLKSNKNNSYFNIYK